MKIIKKAIETYGEEMQCIVAMEELSELIKEIAKKIRAGIPKDNNNELIEEIADVEIMLWQLMIIFEIPYCIIDSAIDKKLRRLEKRLL